ncbi:hypothetical protein FQA39_LY12776 [Lamprigera yunnana]|nr:hypothetical protein FQA39_LY12776 [Lamprigera yunnana]
MSIVFNRRITHQNGGKVLYRDSELRINKGEHVALLGANGTGKTTLLNIITQKITPDHGLVELHPKAKIGYLDQHQEIFMSLKHKLLRFMSTWLFEYKEEDLVKALELQEKLNVHGFDAIEKTVGNLVAV